jgi:hypothetical protein
MLGDYRRKMKKETLVFVCDACKKEQTARETYHSTPGDPWVRLNILGGWRSDFGNAVESDLHACSPKCALEILQKAIDKMKRIQERFPSLKDF